MSTDDVYSKAGPDAVATTGEYETSWEQYQHGDWPYAVRPVNPQENRDAIMWKNGNEYAFEAEDGEIYQGVHPRQMVENAAVTDQPIWLGYDTNEREVCLHLGQVYRGLFIGGYTGTGKTTTASNILLQLAILGYGWLFIDPGGEEIYHLYRRLPDEAADRLVYINPTADIYDQVTGINYFDTIHDPGEPGFEGEVENIVDDILPLLEAEYPRMKGIAENMLRALITMNSEDDHDYNYCPIDLLFALSGEDERQSYANFVDQEKLLMLEPYAKKIADAVDEDLEPLLRRLKSWVESPLVRAIVCQRESDIDLGTAVDENLCIVVNADTGDDRSRRFLSSALQRKVWSASSTRQSKIERKLMQYNGKETGTLGDVPDGEDFKPFFTLSDEFHALADDAMNIGETLAMARKKRQGNILMTQQLNQLTDDQQDQIAGNTSKLAFHPGDSPDEQQALAKAFPGKEKDDLMLDDYHATFIAKDTEGSDSEPFSVHMFPLYPPRRTWEQAHEKIQQSLDRYGSDVLTDEDILKQIPEHFSGAITSDMVQADDQPLTADNRHTIIATAHSMARRRQVDAIPSGDLIDQLLQDDVAVGEYQADNWVEKIVATDYLAYDRRDGDQYIAVTDDGLELIYDSGDAGSGGKRDHRKGVSETLDSLVHPDVGYHAEIVKQDGTELHDLIARLPLPTGGETFEAAKKNRDRIREEMPNAYALAGEQDVAVEFEKGTLDNPHQIARNLAKALNQPDSPHVLFVVEQGDSEFAAKAQSLVRKLVENEMTSLRVPADADRKFWTADKLRVQAKSGAVLGLHRDPDANVEWVEIDGEIILRDNEGVVVRYDELSPSSLPAVANDTDGDGITVFEQATGESRAYGSLSELRKEYKVLYEPFVPEDEFNELPDESDWSVAVNPDDPDVPLQIYDPETGGVTPITKLADNQPSTGEPNSGETGTIGVTDTTGETQAANTVEESSENSTGSARERFEKFMQN